MPTRERPPPTEVEVLRTEELTPRMVRLVLGGAGIAGYRHNDFTDRYVKLTFPPAEGSERAHVRTYTVRRFVEDAGELWIDVVQHGDVGVAGPWAAAARPGDAISFGGPGGAYAPDPTADWHLFVGDPAAFPAIASAIEVLPEGSQAVAVLAAHDEAEAAYLGLPTWVSVRWLLEDRESTTLLDAIRDLDLPDGTVHAFVHGELAQVRAIRTHLVDERGLPADRLSLSGYWRQGLDEDDFQAAKRASRPS